MYKKSKNKDILISCVAGKFDRFFDFKHRLGDLSSIFFTLNNPDVIIVSVSDFITPNELIRVKNYIKNIVGAKIIFYVSTNSRDDNFYGIDDYNLVLNEESVYRYRNQIKFLTRVKVFSKQDLKNKNLYKTVIKLFK